MNLSRKDFFRRGIFGMAEMLLATEPRTEAECVPPVRPPGFRSGREAECYGCDDCSRACPAGIVTGVGGVEGPVLDFSRGPCARCLLCVGACPHGVLTFPVEGKQSSVPGVARCDAGRCLASSLGCFSCVERCPEEAITAKPGEAISVDGERCTGCGACEYVCPLEEKAVKVVPFDACQ